MGWVFFFEKPLDHTVAFSHTMQFRIARVPTVAWRRLDFDLCAVFFLDFHVGGPCDGPVNGLAVDVIGRKRWFTFYVGRRINLFGSRL